MISLWEKKKQHPKPQSCWPFLPLGPSTLGRFLRTGSKMKAIAWFTANIWLSTSPPPLVQMFLLPLLLIFDPLVSVPGDGFHHPIRNNTLVLIPFLWERQGVTPYFSCSPYGGPGSASEERVGISTSCLGSSSVWIDSIAHCHNITQCFIKHNTNNEGICSISKATCWSQTFSAELSGCRQCNASVSWVPCPSCMAS